MLDRISGKLSDVFRELGGKARISEKNVEETVEEIKNALLDADVNLRVVRRFVNRTLEDARGERVLKAVSPGQQFIKIVHDRMVELLGDEKQDLALRGPDTPSVLMLCGLQGSGKTTTAGKLALRLKKAGRRPLLVAADLVRPAAAEQLALLGESIGVPVLRDAAAKDARAMVKLALAAAKKEQHNVVIVDTSGRMQMDEALMAELADLKKLSAPDEILLVADAMTGQVAVDVAKTFDERIGLTGVILSKFDSDARGGAALSLKTVTGKPVKFIGVGERLEDLDVFHPDRIASRILGMGDVVSLVEKAQELVDRDEAERLQEKMEASTFTLADYLDQFRRMKKMGNVQSLLEMVPGLQGRMDEINVDDAELKREEAIILSMTKTERNNHRIIGPSRRKRIARGSGTSVFSVNQLLKKFEKTRIMMRKVTRNKSYQAQLFGQTRG